MGGTDMGSAQHAPAYVIPQAGKSFDDGAEATGTEQGTVFGKDVARPCLINDAEILEPQARTGSGKSCTFTRSRDVLAGVPAADNVDEPPPGSAVKGAHVVPNGEGFEVSFRLASEQDGAGVGVDLARRDRRPSK